MLGGAMIGSYKTALQIGAAVALAGALAYGAHRVLSNAREEGRAEVQALWDAQTARDLATARRREAELTKQRDDAIEQGAKREDFIRLLAAGTNAANLGLRDTIAAVGASMPNYSDDALRSLAGTYGELLAECQGRRTEVAEEAERLNSEKRTLIEAWPTNEKAQ